MNKRLEKIALISLVTSSLLLANDLKKEAIKLDEITVSANKMDETIKEVPQSISLLTDLNIEEREIKSIPEIIEYIPNLSSTFMYSDRVNFRGINTSIFTNNNPVVIYIDGIPHSSVYAFDASILNIERVEVLRGPQGALYGKDSIGGVINIVTKKPSNEVEGFVGLEYGTNNFKQTSFNVSGALIENELFFGLNGLLSEDDGWQTNHNTNQEDDANRSKSHKLNASLYYEPTDKLSVNLNILDDKNYRFGFEGGAAPQNESINDYEREDFENLNYETDTYMKTKSKAQSLKVEYMLNENINFTSVSANKKIDIDGTWDVDLGINPNYDGMSMFQDATSKNFSQEFRISGENKHLRYVFGLYFEKDEFNFHNYGQEYPSYLAGNPFGAGVDVEFNAKSKATSKTYASFGQVVIPFLEDYELTLGGRYQKIEKKMDLDNYMHPINTDETPYFELNEEHTWNTFLPKIALSKRLTDELTTYLTASKGYLPGGYNNFASNGGEKENRFDAQTSINYELGLRGSLLEDKLYLSSSVFYMDIEDIHVYSTDPATSMMYTSNAGEASSKGLEIELAYNINNNWSIDTAIGIVQAKYSEYTDSSGNDNKNKKIERTPSHSLNLGLSYYGGNGLYGRFDIRNQGDMYFNAQNSLKQDSYTVANAKVGYLFKDLDIYAYVKNITDENYIVAVEEMAEFRQLTYGKGRFIGLGLKYSF